MPALFTMMSSGPRSFTAAATARSTSALRLVSAWRARARPPAASMAPAVSRADASSRSTAATRVPRAARARAMARPMPEPAPVTTPTRVAVGVILASVRPAVYQRRGTAMATTLTFRKLHPHFVAEVGPVDLRQAHDPETLARIRSGMDEFAILVFHDQPFTD